MAVSYYSPRLRSRFVANREKRLRNRTIYRKEHSIPRTICRRRVLLLLYNCRGDLLLDIEKKITKKNKYIYTNTNHIRVTVTVTICAGGSRTHSQGPRRIINIENYSTIPAADDHRASGYHRGRGTYRTTAGISGKLLRARARLLRRYAVTSARASCTAITRRAVKARPPARPTALARVRVRGNSPATCAQRFRTILCRPRFVCLRGEHFASTYRTF